MIIFLHGSDDYRRREKREALVGEFLKKHGAGGVGRFDLAEAGDEAGLLSFLANQSMFAPVRLAVVDHPFEAEDPGAWTAALAAHRAVAHTTILLSDAEKPPKAFAFLVGKTKKSEGILVQEFKPLAGAEWTAWLSAEAKKRGAALSSRGLKFLAAAYAGDPWRAVTELDKLALWKKDIDEPDLEEQNVDLAPNFWATIQGLKHPLLGERLATLELLFSRNEPAAKTFNILAAQWAEKAPLFAAYDLAVKSGKCDYEETLLDLLTA